MCRSHESGVSYPFLIQFHLRSLAAFVLVPPSDLCVVVEKKPADLDLFLFACA